MKIRHEESDAASVSARGAPHGTKPRRTRSTRQRNRRRRCTPTDPPRDAINAAWRLSRKAPVEKTAPRWSRGTPLAPPWKERERNRRVRPALDELLPRPHLISNFASSEAGGETRGRSQRPSAVLHSARVAPLFGAALHARSPICHPERSEGFLALRVPLQRSLATRNPSAHSSRPASSELSNLQSGISVSSRAGSRAFSPPSARLETGHRWTGRQAKLWLSVCQ